MPPVGFWEYDVYKNTIKLSDELLTLGNPRNFAEFMDFILPEDRGATRAAIFRSFLLREPFISSFRTSVRPGQPERHIQISAQPEFDKNDRPRVLKGTAQDISGYIYASHVSSEERFRSLFELSAVGVVYGTMDGYIIRANRKFSSMVGWSPTELMGRTIYDFTYNPDHSLTRTHQNALINKIERETVFEKRYIRRDGHIFWVQVTVSTVKGVDKDPAYFVAIVQDIDERRRAEEKQKETERALEEAKYLAISANQAKTAFLANMSHEIRTPLGVILGYSELLQRKQISPEERMEYIRVIIRNGQDLSKLINDILDLSKVEAEKIAIERRPFLLNELVADVIHSLRVKADEKKIRLDLACAEDLPTLMHSDASRLKQILFNIVGNAIKFTDRGAVELRVEMEGKQVAFIVRDSGVGIPESERSKLFQAFSQVDATHTRKRGGTGLGLMLSRRLAEAMGGTVRLESSQVDVGSVFVISIDPGIPQDDVIGSDLSPLPREEESLRGLSILLAEDAADNRFYFSSFLQLEGATVELVENGKEAVEQAMTGKHDLLLMDIQMPIVDGYEATRILRSKGFKKPILALTAHSMQSERELSRLAGFDGHIGKPVAFDELVRIIREFTLPLSAEPKVSAKP